MSFEGARMARGYSEVFQRLLNGYRDRLVSFRGGGWDALWIVKGLSDVAE